MHVRNVPGSLDFAQLGAATWGGMTGKGSGSCHPFCPFHPSEAERKGVRHRCRDGPPEGGEPCGTPLGEPPETLAKGGEPCGTPLGEPPETLAKGGEPCGTPLGEPPETLAKGGEPCGTPLGEPPDTP